MITDNKYIMLFIWLVTVAIGELLWQGGFRLAGILVGIGGVFSLFQLIFINLKDRGGF